MNRYLVMMFAVLTACSLTVTSALADVRGVSDEEGASVRRGTECFMHRDYECARAAMHRAYEFDRSAENVLKLGLAELQSGHPVEAVAHLREYLTHAQEPTVKLNAVRTKWLPRAEASTARLDVFAPMGARVLVDGVATEDSAPSPPGQGKSEVSTYPIVAAAGSHDVTAQNGEVVETRHIAAHGGELVEIHFQRVADAEPPAAMTGTYDVSSRAKDIEHRSSLKPKWIATIALGGAAVVAAGVAIGFSVAFEASGSEISSLRAQSQGTGGCSTASSAAPCPDLRSAMDAQQRNAAIANGFYVGASVAALAAGASWLFWPERKEAAHAIVATPVFGSSGAGLSVSGVW